MIYGQRPAWVRSLRWGEDKWRAFNKMLGSWQNGQIFGLPRPRGRWSRAGTPAPGGEGSVVNEQGDHRVGWDHPDVSKSMDGAPAGWAAGGMDARMRPEPSYGTRGNSNGGRSLGVFDSLGVRLICKGGDRRWRMVLLSRSASMDPAGIGWGFHRSQHQSATNSPKRNKAPKMVLLFAANQAGR